jgi:hypothetical protein
MNITREGDELGFLVGDLVKHNRYGTGEIFHRYNGFADVMFIGFYETKCVPLLSLTKENT